MIIYGCSLRKIKPVHKSNLTALDSWIYGYGDISTGKMGPMEAFLDLTPIKALENCFKNQNEDSCVLVESTSKELGNDHQKIWKKFQPNLFQRLIPLCSYGAKNDILEKCKAFKKVKRGRLLPFGIFKLLYQKRKINRKRKGTNLNLFIIKKRYGNAKKRKISNI